MKRFSDFIFGERKEFTFYSHLNTDECLTRLKSATTKPPAWKELGILSDPKIIVGEFKGPNFQLRRGDVHRNNLLPILYGSISDEAGITNISGYLDLEPVGKLLIIMILLAFSIVFIGQAIQAVISRKIEIPVIFFAPLGVVCFLVIVLKFAINQMQKENKNMLTFLVNTLEASPVTPDELYRSNNRR
jgi:hypothetical protein